MAANQWEVRFDDSRDANVQVFTEAPQLLKIYPDGADDQTFVTFFFTESQADLYSFTSAPVLISLV